MIDLSRKISRHFTLGEAVTTAHHEFDAEQQAAPLEVWANLELLCREGLDRVRDALGCPLDISCAYRCPPLNVRVGGAATSAHLYGLAADLLVPRGRTFRTLWDAARSVPFDQVIAERGCVHYGYGRPCPHGDRIMRGELLVRMPGPDGFIYPPWDGTDEHLSRAV